MKPTPGPWTIKTYDDHMGRYPDNERRPRLVFDVMAPLDERDPKYPRTIAHCGEDSNANARLIAAAPDLLAACKAIIENWERNLTDAARMCREAIDKAEGRE